MLLKLAKKFWGKVRSRGLLTALYIVYYYFYGYFYDLFHGTNFVWTSTPKEHGIENQAATGNFPAHPLILKRFLRQIERERRGSVLDVGCGSGRALHVAGRAGFQKLFGIELVPAHAELARRNLSAFKGTQIICSDVFLVDIPHVDLIFLFRPFPESVFRELLPFLVTKTDNIILLNFSDEIHIDGFEVAYSYRHPIYSNFRGKLWKRQGVNHWENAADNDSKQRQRNQAG